MSDLLNGYRDYGVTILRVALGVIFLMHGYLAAFVLTPAGFTAYNASKGVPFPTVAAWLVILGHLLGGISLVVGAYVRLGALVSLLIMGGAIWFVHLTQSFFMRGIIVDAAKGLAVAGGYEYALFLFAACLAVLFLGSGPLAVDKTRER